MKEPFQCFSNETYEKIRYLNRKKIIEEDVYKQLEDCESVKELKRIILAYFSFKDQLVDKIWRIFREEIWIWKRCHREESTYFNDYQLVFINELIKNNGVYSRERCQKEILTDCQITRDLIPLEETEIIFSFKTKKMYGNHIIYIIHPLLMKKIKERQHEI